MSDATFTQHSATGGSLSEARQSGVPLVVHIIHRLEVGGLENGLVNLINATKADHYRHAIVSLTDCTDFRRRILRDDVRTIALHKREGKDFRTHFRLWRILRELEPAIVHTRNLPALEFLVVAAMAGVGARIHGEHGRDVYDLDGSSRKYNLLRRLVDLFATRYIAVSQELARWLVAVVGVSDRKVLRICNGVDTGRFYPRSGARLQLGPPGFVGPDTVVIGTVGRMQTVKDQLTLARAFIHLVQNDTKARQRARLVMIGDGPLRQMCHALLRTEDLESLVWLPGERVDVPELIRSFDIFILPSIAEGISNTILEAMASGLPVVATGVGGNPELVLEGKTGMLVPHSNPLLMAEAIRSYLVDSGKLSCHGEAGRKRAEAEFSIDAMVKGYLDVYDAVLRQRRPTTVDR